MLRRVGLNNFKCFERLDLPCAPLNLLCGLNGMGKSSVIQALLVLRQSFASGELQAGRLVLGGELVDLGAGSDVLFEDAEGDVIEFVLKSEREKKPREPGVCPVTGRSTQRIFAPGADAAAKSILNRLLSGEMNEGGLSDGRIAQRYPELDVAAFRRALDRARDLGVRHVHKPSEYFGSVGGVSYRVGQPGGERAGPSDYIGLMVDVSWAGKFRYSRAGDQLTAVESTAADENPSAAWRAPPFDGHLHYVQAERVGPRKSYPLSEVAARRGDLGARGEYAWNYLNDHQSDLLSADDPRSAGAPGRRLVDVVDHWLQDVSPGAHLQLEAVPAADAVLAGFAFDRPGDVESRRHRATNVGFGLSYVLPVVLALLAPPGALCLVENPEAHLHPRGQTKLAELAARAATAGVQVFVETHSDHFVDGVRIAVRDGLIPADDAKVHYFERRDGRAAVSSPAIDADGRLSHWPAGFFDQHDENLARLLAPRARR